MCSVLANSGGGVADDGLNFRITICGVSLSFGSCRLRRNFATLILFQMINAVIIPSNTMSCSTSSTIGIAIAAASEPIMILLMWKSLFVCSLNGCYGSQFMVQSFRQSQIHRMVSLIDTL